MNSVIRVLLVEDSEDDVRLMVRTLKRDGFEPSVCVVQTGDEMLEALGAGEWDVVISDFQLPHFTGLDAVTLLRREKYDLPFILVSGTIGEETAVAVMRAGASDYLMKSNLMRLGPAIRRELADVELRRRVSSQLRRSEEMFTAMVEQLPMAIYLSEGPQQEVVYLNPKFKALFGCGAERISVMSDCFPRAYPDAEYRQSVLADWEKKLTALAAGTPSIDPMESVVTSPDGSKKHILWNFANLQDRNMVIGMDITEGRRAEDALRESLKEKEALLKEVHHRVKNNLQVITSLLRLESGRTENQNTKVVLNEMTGRILSMALLHETIYRTGVLAEVDMQSYLQQVGMQAVRAHEQSKSVVALKLDLDPVRLDIDQAIPCGLIVNELISNCLKHAFPAGRPGELQIKLKTLFGTDTLRLCIVDDGVGVAPDLLSKSRPSLGIQLVQDLVRQVRGTIEIKPDEGAHFEIVFTQHKKSSSSLGAKSHAAAEEGKA